MSEHTIIWAAMRLWVYNSAGLISAKQFQLYPIWTPSRKWNSMREDEQKLIHIALLDGCNENCWYRTADEIMAIIISW